MHHSNLCFIAVILQPVKLQWLPVNCLIAWRYKSSSNWFTHYWSHFKLSHFLSVIGAAQFERISLKPARNCSDLWKDISHKLCDGFTNRWWDSILLTDVLFCVSPGTAGDLTACQLRNPSSSLPQGMAGVSTHSNPKATEDNLQKRELRLMKNR